MVKMYEICEGTFVPEECCTFHEPPEGGGHGLSAYKFYHSRKAMSTKFDLF